MKNKQGFTLVELLVVIAIISILATIAIPNVVKFIEKGRMTKALSEVKNIEMALNKMLADADVADFLGLFDTTQIVADTGAGSVSDPALLPVYTDMLYSLLREGREVLATGSVNAAHLNQNRVRKIGLDYMPELGADPWGNRYQMFIGPWQGNAVTNPIIFRKFTQIDDTFNERVDNYVFGPLNVDNAGFEGTFFVDVDDATFPENIGFPASRRKIVYIYSMGGNRQDDQLSRVNYPPASWDVAYDNIDLQYFGGGDDINNWDNERSWERFYN